jgi:uncharacterized protein
MRRTWEWLGLNLGKHAGVVAALGLIVTLVLGVGVVRLTVSTSNADYLNKSDPAWVGNQRYTALLAGTQLPCCSP